MWCDDEFVAAVLLSSAAPFVSDFSASSLSDLNFGAFPHNSSRGAGSFFQSLGSAEAHAAYTLVLLRHLHIFPSISLPWPDDQLL